MTTRSRLLPAPAWLALVLAPAWITAAGAQQFDFGDFVPTSGGLGGRKDEVSLSAQFTPANADRPALLFVTAKIVDGFHMYAVDQGTLPDGAGPQATAITLADGGGVRLLSAFQPLEPPRVHIDAVAWKGLELREHEHEVTWFAPIELAPGFDPRATAISGRVKGQVCNPNMCVPVEREFAARRGNGLPLPPGVNVSHSGAVTGQPAAFAAASAAPRSGGSLGTMAAYGILGGLILNLMPCVLPVIGLKLLSFAKQGGQSRGRVLGLNVAYAAGLMTVFMALATLAALTQLGLSSKSFGWGELNTLTWFKVSMTALVFSMALAFLGVWELPIPGFAASNAATELTTREGPAGAFFMGVFTTLLATPCSGPFLGPVLGYTLSQPPAVTYLLFASVGFGMALPYLAMGAFPSLAAWLPKPGAWMDTLKQLLGFVLLATVVYLFSTIHSDYFIPTLALLMAIWFGCWIVGRTPAWAELPYKRAQWIKAIAATTVLGGGSFLLLKPGANELPWQPYSPAALAAARAQGKTVLVDFTADWCLTCKTNSLVAINRREVRELVEQNGVVPLLADWTDANPAIEQALAELNSRSIPLLAVYPADPQGEILVLPDLLTQGKVIEALQKAGPSLDVGPPPAQGKQPVAAGPDAPAFGARRRETRLQ